MSDEPEEHEGAPEGVQAKARMTVVIAALVTRLDGTVEDLGVIDSGEPDTSSQPAAPEE